MNSAIDLIQDMLPSLGYRELLQSLPFLSDMGVLEDGSLPAALVSARLMDRSRILQSGMKSPELRDALAAYQRSAHGKPVPAVEGAILEALDTARREEWGRLRGTF